MNYSKSTVKSLLARMSLYVGYVTCGCSGSKPVDAKCHREDICAREDFRRMVLAAKRVERKARGK